MLEWIIFAVVSVPAVVLSRRGLANPRAHGFYRLFAFEAIFALVALNATVWFSDPFSPRQLVSWALLILSLGLAIHGFYLLRIVGQPQGPIENTTRLVTVGAYRVIRHPLYASLLYFAWGAFLKQIILFSALLAVAATGFLIATGRIEERENLARFGDEYRAYMNKTRMYIPFVF